MGNTAVPDTTPDPTEITQLQFTNVAAQVGLKFQHGAFRTAIFADPAALMGAGLCWIDYDQDGWQDLCLVNSHAEDEIDHWQANGGLPTNALFCNQNGQFSDVLAQTGTNLALRGDGTFREVTTEVGLAREEWALGPFLAIWMITAVLNCTSPTTANPTACIRPFPTTAPPDSTLPI